jgi:hypothetical protein
MINMSNPGENILKVFNDEGWDSIEPFFGKFENFYKYLKKYGVLNQLYLKYIPDDLYNQYAFLLMEDYPDYVINHIVDTVLTDVEKKGDDYYLRLRDREEVSDFFRGGGYRGDNARDIVKNVMGEDWWEPYYDTTDDAYRDVVEVLNEENLRHFKQRVLEELEGVQIDLGGTSSDEMEEIASEQGHDDHFFVTPENIDRIVDDSDTMENLLKYNLQDIRNNLYSIHSQAYNDAFTSEIWDDVMSELSAYFEPKFHSETVKVGDKTKYIEYLKINDFGQIIYDYLYNYKDSGYNDDMMEYHGSFTGILTKMMDEMSGYDYLDFRIPDYPDSREIDRIINQIFGDYI